VIVEEAESIVRPDTLQADKLLDDIRRAKQEAYEVAERAKQRERQGQLLEADLRYQLAQIEQVRRAVIAETRTTMQAELEEVRKEVEQLRRQARSGFGSVNAAGHEDFLVRAEKELSRRKQATEEVNQRVVVPGRSEDRLTGPIEVGDIVWVASLQASGEVLAVYDATNEADVQLGNFRLKLPVKRLELRQKAVKETAAPAIRIQNSGPAPSPGIELDLRGERVEEGIDRLERYLNDAYRARLPFVRIIHGHGTGAMKSAVRDALNRHPLVGTMRSGDAGEGGDGVTMVKLVSS
jgi:DNA mismatch repair protein MutS2